MTLIDELREICKGMSAANHTGFQYECMKVCEFYDEVEKLRKMCEQSKEDYKRLLKQVTPDNELSKALMAYLMLKDNYKTHRGMLDRVLKRMRKELQEYKELGVELMNEYYAKKKVYNDLYDRVLGDKVYAFEDDFNESKYAFMAVCRKVKAAKENLKQKKKELK